MILDYWVGRIYLSENPAYHYAYVFQIASRGGWVVSAWARARGVGDPEGLCMFFVTVRLIPLLTSRPIRAVRV